MANLKLNSSSQMINMDSITKTIESTVLSQFKKLASNLQNELKLELQVPTEITTKKTLLNKQIRDIQNELNQTLKTAQDELNKEIEKRWQFNRKGTQGTDSKGKPVKLQASTDLEEIRKYKNQRLALIKQTANVTDDSIELQDPKKFHQLIQNVMAYEKAIQRMRELSSLNGVKYKPDEGDLNLEKIFSGYKFSGDVKSNAESMAKVFAATYTSTLNIELQKKSAEQADVMREYNRSIARSANQQEGVGYEYDNQEYQKSVRQREEAEVQLARSEANIEQTIRKEIDAYIELENLLNSDDISDQAFEDLQIRQDNVLAKLLQAIDIVKKYGIEIGKLSKPANEILGVSEEGNLADYLINYAKGSEIEADRSFLTQEIKDVDFARGELSKALQSESQARQILDTWKELMLSMRDTDTMRETVDQIASDQINASLSELQNENNDLKQRIADLEVKIKEVQAREQEAKTDGSIQLDSQPGSAVPSDFTEFNDALRSSAQAVTHLGDAAEKVANSISNIDIKSLPVVVVNGQSNQVSNSNLNEHQNNVNSVSQEKVNTEKQATKELSKQYSIQAEIEAAEKRRLTLLNNRRNVQLQLNKDIADAEIRRQKEEKEAREQAYAKQAFAIARERLAFKESQQNNHQDIAEPSIKSAKESAAVLVTTKEIIPVLEKAAALSQEAFQFKTKDDSLKAFAKDVESTAENISAKVRKIYDNMMKLYADRVSGQDNKQLDRKIAKNIYALDQLNAAGYDTSSWRSDIDTIKSDIDYDKFKQTSKFTGASDKLVQGIIKLVDEVEAAVSQLEQRLGSARTAALEESKALEQYDFLKKNAKRYITGTLSGDSSDDWDEFAKHYEQAVEYVQQIKDKTDSILNAEKELNEINEKVYSSMYVDKATQAAFEEAKARLQARKEAELEAQAIERIFTISTSQKSAKESWKFFEDVGMISNQEKVESDWLSKLEKYRNLSNKITFLEADKITKGLTAKQSTDLENYIYEIKELEKSFDGLDDAVLTSDKVRDAVNNLSESGQRDLLSYNKVLKEFNKNFTFVSKLQSNDESDVRSQVEQYIKSVNGKDFKGIKNGGMKNGVISFTSEFTAADGVAQKINLSLNTAQQTLRGIVKDGRQAGDFFVNLGETISKRWRLFIGYLSTQFTVMRVWGTLKQGIGIVKELDSAFVELKRISNDTSSALENFRKQSFELADSVGTTSATIINAATEWEHLGYSIKDAAKLAETSAVYKNIADGMTSDSEATQDLVSILKAYNFTADQAMDVTDALIATSNNFAVTAADIGNILKRSSAALAMGGNSFEETVALGTAMSEVLQSAEVAGQSLKVLSLRLRSSKTELEEMGEETDNLVESTPKLRGQIKALTKGFDILSSDGKTIKSTYEIMSGIAKVWKDMSDVDQAALLELIAGKTRAQGVSALLTNWSQVDKVLKVIAEDEGIALRNNEEKLNTIQGRITKLTNAGQKLASDTFSVESIKSFISFGTSAVNILDEIIQKIGSIPTAIGVLGGINSIRTKGGLVGDLWNTYKSLPKYNKNPYVDVSVTQDQYDAYRTMAFNNQLNTDAGKQAISGLGEEQKRLLSYMTQNNMAFEQQQKALKELGSAAQKSGGMFASFGSKAVGAVKGLGLAFANAALVAAVSFVVTNIIKIVADGITYFNRLGESAQSAAKQIKDSNNTLDSYANKIEEQNKIIHSHSSSIDEVNAAQSNLRQIKEEMLDLYGKEADGYDMVTKAIDGEKDAIKALKKVQAEKYIKDWEDQHNSIGDQFGRFIANVSDSSAGEHGKYDHSSATSDVRDMMEEYNDNFASALLGAYIQETNEAGGVTLNRHLNENIKKAFEDYANSNGLQVGSNGNVSGYASVMLGAWKVIQEQADKEFALGNISENVYKQYTAEAKANINNIEKVINKYGDIYGYLLELKDIPDVEGLEAKLNELDALANQFEKDGFEGQLDTLGERYIEIMDSIKNDPSLSVGVRDYVNNLYKNIDREIRNWHFKIDIKENKDDLKDSIQKTIDEMSAKAGHTITAEELTGWNRDFHSNDGLNTYYDQLNKYITSTGATMGGAIPALVDSGVLLSDELSDLKDYFNEANLDIDEFSKRVDTSTLKSTKNLKDKFASALNSVKGNYKNTTDAAVAAWQLVERAEKRTAEQNKDISGEQLSKIEGSLSKLKNDIFDSKGNVKTTTFKNKDFLDAFGDIPDFVDPAINALDKFQKVVQTTTDKSQIQKAFDELATSYIWNLDEMKGLTEENAKYVEGALSQGGVVNAAEMVASALAKARAETALSTIEDELNRKGKLSLTEASAEMDEATLQTINGLVAQESAADGTRQMLANLVIQQMILNGTVVNTEGSQEQLRQLAQTAGYAKSEVEGLVKAMALSATLESLGVSDAGKRRYTNVEGAERQKLINQRRNVAYQESAKQIANLIESAVTTGPSESPGGQSGNNGNSNKEPSKTDKEFDYVNRYLQVLQEQNDELRENVDNQYIIMQDAAENTVDFSSALSDLGAAQQELTSLGVSFMSDEFQTYLDELDLSDTADSASENAGKIEQVYDGLNQVLDDTLGYVQPRNGENTFLGQEVEDFDSVVAAAKKYKTALSNLEKAKDKTSKTLSENGTGQLTYIKQLQQSDQKLIDAYEHAAKSYQSEWEDYQKKIVDSFGEEKGKQYINDIMFGNLDPEEWEKIITYDSNSQEDKDRVENLERGQTAYDHQKESLKSMREWQQKLNDDIQKEYEIRLNIIKAEALAIQNQAELAQYNLDMKEVLGEVVQESDYQDLIDINDDLIANYENQLDVLNEQLGTLDEGEQAWYDCQSAIYECESSIREAKQQQAEWNDTILRLPVENMQRFLKLLQNIGQDLENFLAIQEAMGKDTTPDQISKQWEDAYDQITADQGGFTMQAEKWLDILENYDLGSEKFSEVDDSIQECEDSVTSLIEEMVELNSQLLNLPIDKIAEMTDYLNNTLTDLGNVQTEFETAINAVINLINKQIEDLQDEYDQLESDIEDQIKPLQDQIDQLEKSNDLRSRQLAIEQAQLALEKARDQRTTQVIRNGRVQYERDEDAYRDAEGQLADAEYNKLIGDLNDEIDALNDQLADAQETLDDDIKSLTEALEERWETIMPDTQTNRDEEIATRIFGDGWKELVLAGKNSQGVYADEGIYQAMRKAYEENSVQQRDVNNRIQVNEIITSTLQKYVEDFQAEKITAEEMSSKISSLINIVKDGLVTGQEGLSNTLTMGGYETLGNALASADKLRSSQLDTFNENLQIAQERRDQIDELTLSWEEFSNKFDEYREQLKADWDAIDFIGETAKEIRDIIDDDDDGEYNPSDGVWSSGPAIESTHNTGYIEAGSGPGAYADGLEGGQIGRLSASEKFKQIQALGLQKLDPDEIPAILHAGEGVINGRQQSNILGNMRSALALGARGIGSAINITMGDITLPNVTNGKEFAESLAQNFTPIMNQYFSKVFQ